MEQFANTPNTQLSGAINNSVTSITVVSSVGFPATGNFRILLDAEIMLVTSISGTTWTVTRGDGGTTATSHGNGTQIYGVVTKEALDAIISFLLNGSTVSDRRIINIIGAIADDVANSRVNIYINKHDTIANLDGTIPPAGAIFRPKDSPNHFVSDGSKWIGYGPALPQTIPPAASGLTWINQGGATVTQRNDGFYIEDVSAGRTTDCLRMLVKAVPGSTPYSLTIGGIPNNAPFNSSYQMWGPCFCDSGAGPKIMTWGYMVDLSNPRTGGIKYNSPTSFSANFARSAEFFSPFIFYKIRNDGTKLQFWRSFDGVNFMKLFEENVGNFLTPTRYGVYINPYASSPGLGFLVTHWSEGT